MSTDTPVTAGSEAVFFSVLMLYMEYGNISIDRNVKFLFHKSQKYVMLVAVNMTLRLIARYIAVRFFVCRSSEESAEWGCMFTQQKSEI